MTEPAEIRVVAPGPGEQSPATDREAWIAAGRDFGKSSSDASWQFADWLAAGLEAWGREALQVAAETTGASRTKISHYLAVARAYPIVRRRTPLGFSHHLEVARLPEAEADRLLDQAEAEGWSRATLREVVREGRETQLERLRAENARLRRENAALRRGDDRQRATIEAERLREDVRADCKAFVLASRRIAELLEAAAESPGLVALHGNARAALVRWIRNALKEAGAQAAEDAASRALPAVARLAGEDRGE